MRTHALQPACTIHGDKRQWTGRDALLTLLGIRLYPVHVFAVYRQVRMFANLSPVRTRA